MSVHLTLAARKAERVLTAEKQRAATKRTPPKCFCGSRSAVLLFNWLIPVTRKHIFICLESISFNALARRGDDKELFHFYFQWLVDSSVTGLEKERKITRLLKWQW